MIASYTEYRNMYGAAEINESEFEWFSYNAEKTIKDHTTGVDGICKLDIAFPTDEFAGAAVKRCFCELVSVLYVMDNARKLIESNAIKDRGDGTVSSGIVQSASSGSESMSFGSIDGALATDALRSASDATRKKRLLSDIVKRHLSGVSDSNGVKLLYMGAYPYVQ